MLCLPWKLSEQRSDGKFWFDLVILWLEMTEKGELAKLIRTLLLLNLILTLCSRFNVAESQMILEIIHLNQKPVADHGKKCAFIPWNDLTSLNPDREKNKYNISLLNTDSHWISSKRSTLEFNPINHRGSI